MTATQVRLHPIPDACEILGVGRSMVFELIKSGELRSVKVGRRRLISSEALEEYIRSLSEVA